MDGSMRVRGDVALAGAVEAGLGEAVLVGGEMSGGVDGDRAYAGAQAGGGEVRAVGEVEHSRVLQACGIGSLAVKVEARVAMLGHEEGAPLIAFGPSAPICKTVGLSCWHVPRRPPARGAAPRSGPWPVLLLLACSVRPSPPSDSSGAGQVVVPPEPQPEPVIGDRHCDDRCCPRGMPVVQLADAGAVSKTASCLVASTAPDRIQVGPLGGLVVAGDGDDTIIGSELRDTVLGDDGDDTITGALGSDHLDGGFGRDRIEGGDHADFILGGPGDDTIYGEQAEGTPAHPGNDIIHGGPGVDTIHGGPGDDQIFGGLEGDIIRGGDDDDTIIGAQGDDQLYGDDSRDWLSGGAGNDTIHGGPGGDTIHPGIGRDSSYGDDGNDTFIINSECELQPGEVLDGGPGADRVLSPMTEQELIARGVELVSIETFEQRWRGDMKPGETIGSTTVCRFQDPAVDILEVSGTVMDTDVVWLDEDGGLQQPDSKKPGAKRIFTRHLLRVDTVYTGDITTNQTIPILLAGGTIRMDDGSSSTQSACCYTGLKTGSRYRVVLRDMKAPDGSHIGWEYEWLVESPPNHSLVLPLGRQGPISMASNELIEYYAPPCPGIPLPDSFRTNRKAIEWAKTLGHRWDQTVDLCGGTEPCLIAAPQAYMDRNMTLTDSCGEPDTFRLDRGGMQAGDPLSSRAWSPLFDGRWTRSRNRRLSSGCILLLHGARR